MKRNVGTVDRIIRIVLGLAGVGIALGGVSPWGWLGVILLATAAASYCPIWMALGVSTAKKPGPPAAA
jgi:hypothetical protein